MPNNPSLINKPRVDRGLLSIVLFILFPTFHWKKTMYMCVSNWIFTVGNKKRFLFIKSNYCGIKIIGKINFFFIYLTTLYRINFFNFKNKFTKIYIFITFSILMKSSNRTTFGRKSNTFIV